MRARKRQHRALGFSRHCGAAKCGGVGSAASDPKAIGIGGHIAQWRDFVRAVREQRPPASTFRDGFEAARLVDAIYRSAAEGRAVSPNEIAAEAIHAS
ncbi:Gfo/Idh/MocA family oxidoreductase [Bradyrhizobium sp. RT7b]|uniref:Gfo/Idh/MocA family oxidoreductase n=1 Tax=unclassified Bradyrhizobium TaxID=2631580 RepID=UPI00339A8DB5